MFDINKYIRRDSIRQMMESHVFISDEDQLKQLYLDIVRGKNPRVIFSYPALKNQLLSMLQADDEQYYLINCNCSADMFAEILDKSTERIIFNNINKCVDEDIIKIVDNTAGIILC